MVTTPSGIESPGREELGPAVPPQVLLLQLEKRLLLVADEDASVDAERRWCCCP